jgi:hypothetical protein
MSKNHKGVELHLPLETLVDTLCKLPQEDLIEIKRQIEERLQNTGPMVQRQEASGETLDDMEDAEFWNRGLGCEILEAGGPSIALEEALKITAKIKGSLAAYITAEREER